MVGRKAGYGLLLLCLLSILVVDVVRASQPEKARDNKFRSRTQRSPDEILFGKDATGFAKTGKCHHDVNLVWRASLGSGIPATPLIADLRGNGDKEIISTTNSYFVEVVEGHNGKKESGWPFAFASSTFSTSPLLYDVNKDGADDIVAPTSEGEIVFISQGGLPSYGKTLKVPPLRVHKEWFAGLTGDNIIVSLSLQGVTTSESADEQNSGRRKLLQSNETKTKTNSASNRAAGSTQSSGKASKVEGVPVQESMWEGFGGSLTKDGIESLELFLPSDIPGNLVADGGHDLDPLFSEQFPHDNYVQDPESSHLWVDAHILATPVIADIDGDRVDDLIVPVSYYFDPIKYDNPVERRKLGPNIDINNYIAGGVVIFDLGSLTVKKEIPLDITMRHTYSAYVTASPTVVDLNRDGNLEIIIPTGVGYIYVIDSDGTPRTDNGFPVMLDSIFGEVAVADLLGDGKLEMIVADSKSNLAVFDHEGRELWETRISGGANSAPVMGDVDGDGTIDIVIATTAGHLWAVRGDNGKPLEHFPIKVHGEFYSRALLIDLGGLPQLQIILSSSDGHMYIADGKTGCVDRVDIGEPSLSSVLADDVTGNGMVDLIVSTSYGNIFCFDTSTPFHPSRTWTGQNQGVNSFVAKSYQTIYVTPATRSLGEVVGETFPLEFHIVDKRPHKKDSKPHYRVKAFLGRELIFEKEYYSPGVYLEHVPAPNRRLFTTVTVEMLNEFHQHFTDSFSINFNVYFYRTLKYILLLPFCIMALALYYSKDFANSAAAASLRAELPFNF